MEANWGSSSHFGAARPKTTMAQKLQTDVPHPFHTPERGENTQMPKKSLLLLAVVGSTQSAVASAQEASPLSFNPNSNAYHGPAGENLGKDGFVFGIKRTF